MTPKSTPNRLKAKEQAEQTDNARRSGADPCATPTDPMAPAGASNSLGAKSDCNGRPATDDSVVEAKDEMGPGVRPPANAGDRS